MPARRQVSSGRKLCFYLGYLSWAVAAAMVLWIALGPFHYTWSSVRSVAWRAGAALGLAVLGLFLRRIAIRGLAGSLVVLDPPRAREDLEPWSRAAGGLIECRRLRGPGPEGAGAVRPEGDQGAVPRVRGTER